MTLTHITLDTDMGTYWIATTTQGEKCFVHATEVNNYPDCDEFSAIVVPNKRQHPPLYAKRISDKLEITAPTELITGYDAKFDMAYAAGLCFKIVILDQNGSDVVSYAPRFPGVYIEEYKE